MIKRIFEIEELFWKGKVLIIFGPRRVGKTTLLKDFLANTDHKYKLDSGENILTQQVFESQSIDELGSYVEGYDLLAIDEAQKIKNISMGLKILVDSFRDLKIVVTGSSSFDLSQKRGEPLTGRKRTIMLYPFSQEELLRINNRYELNSKLSEFLVFGSYPEVIVAKSKTDKIEILRVLVSSYLLKDILALGRIRGPKELIDLLKLLAFQVGSAVSLNELSSNLKIDVKTVDRYLDILEKGFVIYRLGSFSRNLRKEITRKSKYYFWDNGIRNAIISQFNDLKDRNDTGKLFENFMILERLKYLSNNFMFKNNYFWRTYDRKEIDLIEEGDGKLNAYEFKYSDNAKIKKPVEFLNEYQNSFFTFYNSKNYLDFILP
ncbi:MAG: ATP-binding protein [Melioribacteraceae bacterium]|nr:ATP-binding protein [Melioribacteraceae bacterium]